VSVPEFFQRKRMEEELRQSHESLERRVGERTAELRAANERLRTEIAERQRAEEVRDEFLSVAAHELKTPLTSLRGFAQLLLRQSAEGAPPDPQRVRRGLEAIDRQCQKLSQLVSQLLDVSRLQAGRLVLEQRATDLVAIVAGVVDALQTVSAEPRVRLSGASRLMATVDPLRLEQVVTNLLDNALKYSDGPVEVEVRARASGAAISVRDRGPGVPAEHRERIFDRFFRADDDRRPGGMGLGLYISRQIVELHGGRLSAEFPAGGGSRFLVTLPAGHS
jgi:signal transduction histidine kinase